MEAETQTEEEQVNIIETPNNNYGVLLMKHFQVY
jgi:hypothetical protein